MSAGIEPLEHDATYVMSTDVPHSMRLVQDYLVGSRHGHPLDSTPTSLSVSLGSRSALRIWGLLAGTKRLPLKLSVSLSALDDGTLVDLHFVSDEGFYLIRAPWAADAYSRAYDRIVSQLKSLS